jgi:glucose/arabinose dehydrogenase
VQKEPQPALEENMMKRRLFTTVVITSVAASAVAAQSPVQRSTLHDYRIVKVAEGLVNPWSMAFLPNGDVLVTERPGRLRIIRQGRLLPNPVEGVPAVHAVGQGGLLDVVLHPNFASNQLVYISYSKPLGDSTATTAIARGKWENDRLTNVQDVWVATTRGSPRSGHYGSRIAFDRNGFMYVTVGDRQAPPSGDLPAHPAQDFSNNHGSINRLHDDGRVPNDNPFVGRENMRPEIWSKGHRNPQGLAVDPATGEVWATEHGPQGGDELNLIAKGKNYGWPVIGYGVNYQTGSAIHSGTHKEGMEQPRHIWVPSIGASGLTFYTGDKFPGWKGSLFAGGLVGEQLVRLTVDGQRVEVAEVLVRRQGRIRDVRQSPDGYIYLAIDHRQGQPTPILRLEPVGRN